MKLVKFNGIKDERIIKGKRFVRTEETMMALRDFNSHIGASFSTYDHQVERIYNKLKKSTQYKDKTVKVFGEIIRERQNRALYLTVYLEEEIESKENSGGEE